MPDPQAEAHPLPRADRDPRPRHRAAVGAGPRAHRHLRHRSWEPFDGAFINDDATLRWIADDGRRRGDDARGPRRALDRRVRGRISGAAGSGQSRHGRHARPPSRLRAAAARCTSNAGPTPGPPNPATRPLLRRRTHRPRRRRLGHSAGGNGLALRPRAGPAHRRGAVLNRPARERPIRMTIPFSRRSTTVSPGSASVTTLGRWRTEALRARLRAPAHRRARARPRPGPPAPRRHRGHRGGARRRDEATSPAASRAGQPRPPDRRRRRAAAASRQQCRFSVLLRARALQRRRSRGRPR